MDLYIWKLSDYLGCDLPPEYIESRNGFYNLNIFLQCFIKQALCNSQVPSSQTGMLAHVVDSGIRDF